VHWAEFALGPDVQCAWPTPAASAQPTHTACARPAATRGTARVRSACAAHGVGRAARAAHGAAALLGDPATTRRRRTGDGGAPAWRQRQATGDGGCGDGGRGDDGRLRSGQRGFRPRWPGRGVRCEAALSGGRAARGDGRRGAAWGARSGAARRKRGALSGRAVHGHDSGLKPLCRCGAWRPRGSGALPRVPGAACDD
jgi:hypothetical protein